MKLVSAKKLADVELWDSNLHSTQETWLMHYSGSEISLLPLCYSTSMGCQLETGNLEHSESSTGCSEVFGFFQICSNWELHAPLT